MFIVAQIVLTATRGAGHHPTGAIGSFTHFAVAQILSCALHNLEAGGASVWRLDRGGKRHAFVEKGTTILLPWVLGT